MLKKSASLLIQSRKILKTVLYKKLMGVQLLIVGV